MKPPELWLVYVSPCAVFGRNGLNTRVRLSDWPATFRVPPPDLDEELVPHPARAREPAPARAPRTTLRLVNPEAVGSCHVVTLQLPTASGFTRRSVVLGALAGAGSLALAGCGTSSSSKSGGGTLNVAGQSDNLTRVFNPFLPNTAQGLTYT